MRRAWLYGSALGLALVVASSARLEAQIRNLSGFQSNTLQANDDLSSSSVALGFGAPVNFFGTTYSSLFVNNNGNVTFSSPLGTFTPFGLTGNTGIPIIAAYFGDVDTRGNPSIGRGNTDPQPFSGSGLVTYGNATVGGRAAFGVNYFSDCSNWTGAAPGPTAAQCPGGLAGVGYFSAHADKTNLFQLILIDRADVQAGAFDIEFNYRQIQWETGDASGGTGGLGGGTNSARVGYSAGTGATGTFAELPGSGVPGSFLDGGPQSLSRTARLLYEVRNGQVTQIPSVPNTTVPEPATVALTAAGLAIMGLGARRRVRA